MNKFSMLMGALFLLISLSSKAQFKVIASGPKFEEPEKGFAKILQLKNGYTLFIQSENMKNFRIKIYNSGHQQIVTKNLETPKIAPLRGCDLEAIFEVNGQIVIFFSGYSSTMTPILFRYIVAPEDGKVVSETEVTNQDRLNEGHLMSYSWDDVPYHAFIIIKDDNSENYALGYVNSFSENDNKRVNIIHFNNRHEEISKSYFIAPSNTFKNIQIRHLCVISDKEVVALLYATNAEKSKENESSVLLASFSNNNTDVKYNELEIPVGYELGRAILRYNPITKKINLASFFQLDKKILKQLDIEQGDIRNCMMFHEITPLTMEAKKGPTLNPEAANKLFIDLFASKLMFGKKIPYQGLFQNMYVNRDGSNSLIFEGYDIVNSQTTGQNSHSSSDTYLSDIFVINIAKDGLSQNSVIVPKQHRIEKTAISGGGNYSTNQYKRTINLSPFGAGNQFKYFSYVPGIKNDYILFNDDIDNEAKIRKGKRTIIQGIGGSDAFSFITNGNETMPTRNYLLGAPPEKEHQVALLGISDYEVNTNTYVTLKLELDGRDKKVRLVWLQPE